MRLILMYIWLFTFLIMAFLVVEGIKNFSFLITFKVLPFLPLKINLEQVFVLLQTCFLQTYSINLMH